MEAVISYSSISRTWMTTKPHMDILAISVLNQYLRETSEHISSLIFIYRTGFQKLCQSGVLSAMIKYLVWMFRGSGLKDTQWSKLQKVSTTWREKKGHGK